MLFSAKKQKPKQYRENQPIFQHTNDLSIPYSSTALNFFSFWINSSFHSSLLRRYTKNNKIYEKMPTVADLNSLVYDYLVEECKSGAKAFKKADGIVMDKAGATAAWGGRTLQAVHAEHTAGGESSSDSSSSSSSSSDSSSDSESVKAAPKAVAAKDDSDSDSDSSSDDSSSSSSSSSKPARKPSSSPVKRVVTTKLVLKKSPRNSPQIAAKIASKRKAESEAGGPKKKKVVCRSGSQYLF